MEHGEALMENRAESHLSEAYCLQQEAKAVLIQEGEATEALEAEACMAATEISEAEAVRATPIQERAELSAETEVL